MQQWFQLIEKVSFRLDTWTTTKHLAILGITIYWIDDMWNLHKCVLTIKELCESYESTYIKQVLNEVIVDYNLNDKEIFFLILAYFCTKYLFSLFCIVVRNYC